MSKEALSIVILAAGRGTRMGIDLPKVLVATSEGPLINHVLSTARSLSPQRLVVVTGYRRELVEQEISSSLGAAEAGRLAFAAQHQQLGTGDAVRSALPALEHFIGTVLILYGDSPLLQPDTLNRFIAQHHADRATLSFISFIAEEENQYGRVLRDDQKQVLEIREARDCSPEQLAVTEVNSGVYLVDSSFLSPAIEDLKNENAQGEYYLTDIVAHAVREGQRVCGWLLEDPREVWGVNTNYDLSLVNGVLRMRNVEKLIQAGVVIEDPATLYIESTVEVQPGAVLGPNLRLLGSTKIEGSAVLEGSSYLQDTVVGSRSRVRWGCRTEGAIIGEECVVGPFAHLRPGTVLQNEVKIGNFVETKKAHLARGAKASHLTYLGDCTVGEEANIGAGTITCNYDGTNKAETKIGQGAFIGSNTSLVAPVTVGKNATVGAGSVITKEVPAGALALTRAPLTVKERWKKRSQS